MQFHSVATLQEQIFTGRPQICDRRFGFAARVVNVGMFEFLQHQVGNGQGERDYEQQYENTSGFAARWFRSSGRVGYRICVADGGLWRILRSR